MKKLTILTALIALVISCSKESETSPTPDKSTAVENQVESLYSQDSLALAALYNSTDGKNWHNSKDWNTTPTHLRYGIKTEKIDGVQRVVSIRLINMGLNGSLPAELGKLTELKKLILNYNKKLTGTIPEEIYNLRNLTVLDLGFTALTGEISEKVGYLQNLDSLNLSKPFFYHENLQLTGSIPESIGTLKSLRYLNLDNNALSGSIPESIGSMENIEILQIWNNQLSGSIPESIGNLNHLKTLFSSGNKLSGSIPESICRLKNINAIYLSENSLTGTIPSLIGNMTSLGELDLGDNNLSGTIPTSITNLKNLKIFRAGNNKLTGTLPNGICNENPVLTSVVLDNNLLTGEIPILTGFKIGTVVQPWYCSLSLKGNRFTGDIPAWILQFPRDCRKNLIPQQSGYGFNNENLIK